MKSPHIFLSSRVNTPSSPSFCCWTGAPALSALFWLPLNPLQHLCNFPVLGAPALDVVLQMGPHRSRAEGHNHLPLPAAPSLLMQPRTQLAFRAATHPLLLLLLLLCCHACAVGQCVPSHLQPRGSQRLSSTALALEQSQTSSGERWPPVPPSPKVPLRQPMTQSLITSFIHH